MKNFFYSLQYENNNETARINIFENYVLFIFDAIFFCYFFFKY